MGHNQYSHLNKANGPNRPRKANLGQQLPDHARKDKPARSAPTRRDAQDESSSPEEVGRQDGHERTEHAAGGKTHAEALGEEELPIGGAEGRGEDAGDLKNGAGGKDDAEEAGVNKTAG